MHYVDPDFKMLYCPVCKKETAHHYELPNYLLHITLVVLTGGLWVLPYCIYMMFPHPPTCCECKYRG